MVFKMRSDLLQRKICRTVHKNNRMRISHGNTGHPVLFVIHYDLFVNGLLVFGNNRNLCRRQDRLSHIHTDRFCDAVFHCQVHIFHFSAADNRKLRLICQPLVMHVLRNAADAVSTHLCPRAIRVIHLHLKIRFVRRIDKNHAVAADTKMTVTGKADKFRLLFLRYFFCKSVDINVIIAAALHFCKSDFHKVSFSFWTDIIRPARAYTGITKHPGVSQCVPKQKLSYFI